MIPLTINKKGNFVDMVYKSDSDYFKIYDELEDKFYNQFDYPTRMHILGNPKRREEANSLYTSEVKKPAHRTYFWSLEYSLRELLNHFKALGKLYGGYLILDYYFHGIFLKDDDKEMHHCHFGADDEEFEDSPLNSHLLGEPLSKFIEDLTHQTELGEIRIKSIKVSLVYNKQSNPKRKRTHIPRGMRHEVFKRDNYTCVECGARKEDGVTLHIDHIIPVSKGGTDELSNLQTLCKACNLNKSDVIQ
ncbi:MAG: HNH endonuclease [Methanobrevibacter sp.]|nr:HNH endonuclease [Methanobrevibacter sp.]